jgi:hypothetical protein
MKYVFALVLGALFAGCTSDAEDRAFFNSGWVRPERGADERLSRR